MEGEGEDVVGTNRQTRAPLEISYRPFESWSIQILIPVVVSNTTFSIQPLLATYTPYSTRRHLRNLATNIKLTRSSSSLHDRYCSQLHS